MRALMDEVVEPPALKGGAWSPRKDITVSITVKETEHPVGTVKNRVSGKGVARHQDSRS